MDRYSFVLELAERLGFTTAAVYDRLYGLCLKQKSRHARHYDGLYWVRMPSKDFPRVFPYLPAKAVGRALRKLRDEGLVREVHCGHIRWYATT